MLLSIFIGQSIIAQKLNGPILIKNCDNDDVIGATRWVRDADGDGYGKQSDFKCARNQPLGYIETDLSDCDDTNPAITTFRKWYRDTDGDGYGVNVTINACTRPAGYASLLGDCNDANPAIYPGAHEICDGIDNNCSGNIDENTPGIPAAINVNAVCGNTTLIRPNPPAGVVYYWQSNASGLSTSNSANSVTRTNGTNYYLRGKHLSSGCWGPARSVSYTIKTIPLIPPVITVTQNCESTILTRATPPSGITYYWQSSISGIESYSLNNSSNSITRTDGNAYYLRARDNNTGCWGPVRSVNYTIKLNPSKPPTPTVVNNCGNSVLTRSNPPSGITYYWQSNEGGTSTSNNSNTITRTVGSRYYLRARNNSTGCWGAAKVVNYTIKSVPAVPASPEITQYCGYTKIARYNPPSGEIWYWQSTATGTSTANTATYLNKNNGTTVYLRSRNNEGCWSPARVINYTINSTPIIPPVVTVTQNCGITILTRNTPPSGITYYWQNSSTGQSTNNSLVSINRTSGTTYYLRARSNAGCWSTAQTINYSIQNGTVWYADVDGDGFGDPNEIQSSCTQPAGYVANNEDQCPTVTGTENGCLPDQYQAVTLSNENYVYTKVFQTGITTSTQVDYNSDVIENIAYFDGLGRPKQQIAIKGSPTKKDVVTHIVYDPLGRQEKEYLPYSSQTAVGSYKSVDIAQDIQAYYQTKYPADFDGMPTTTVNAYSQTHYEASPLNRVLEQAAPGKSWLLDKENDTDHTIKFEWDSNVLDEVVYFRVVFDDENTEKPILIKDGMYAPNKLYKTIIKDENWTAGNDHTTQEFKNKRGQVVLKRTFNIDIPHDTYYVYDDFGNLSYVLPPKVTTINGVSESELIELSYQYKYDYRNRLIEKKIPGKGWESIVYNKLDQPVLTQDANLKAAGIWLFTKYDAIGRVVYTGKVTDNRDRIAMQAQVSQSNHLWEARVASTMIDGKSVYYSNTAFPTADITLLTINYYDDYRLPSIVTLSPETTDLTWEGMTAVTQVKGLSTVSQVRVLDTDKWITTTNYYDEKGRPWETHIKNDYLGVDDWILSKLDFVGKPLKTFTKHIKDGVLLCTTDTFTYDHVGRLLTQEQQINSQPIERLVSNQYDEIGQLVRKDVGGKATAITALQQVDYQYNVRGWLTGINDVATLGNDLFSFGINYDTVTHGLEASALYNGNISETYWKTANESVQHAYGYQYDALNRITKAKSETGRYDLGLVTYDTMGNITQLQRTGHTNEAATTFGMMDNLTYSYDAGNKLEAVTDISTNVEGFRDGNTTGNDYSYDVNGNMIVDQNKGITNINYNHLNLPTGVAIANAAHTGNINYIYDATGVKQKKIVTEGSTMITTEYAGNYIYKNGSLEFFNHAEGYIEPTVDGNFDYVYQYKDHLGNIRLSYTDSDNDGKVDVLRNNTDVDGDNDNHHEIVEEKNYYPFGLQHKGYNNTIVGAENNYKQFQGQEYTEDLGLNTHEWKYRVSDPAIGRFWQIDPLAEDYVYNGTYNFAENRVIDGYELEGLEWVDTDDGWQYQGYDYDSPQPLPQSSVGVAPEGSSPVAAWVSQGTAPSTSQILNIGGPNGNVQQFTANSSGMVELPHSGTEQTGANSSGTFEVDGYVVYGYFNRNDVAGAVEDQWGTPDNVANMINSVVELNQNSLITNPIQIGDMRSPTNGATNINSTSTHHANNGAFDIRLLGENGGLAGGTTVNSSNYSSQNTQLLVNALGNNGFTRFLIGPNAVSALNNSGTTNVQNGGTVHNNHYHVDVD